MQVKTVLLLLLSAIGQTAWAEGWEGQAELGYLRTSGNTDSENISFGLDFKRLAEIWTHDINLGVYRASIDDEKSADNIDAEYTLRRKLSERSNLFLSAGYLDDEFDGFSDRLSIAGGYGYKLFDLKPTYWEIGIGAGYRDVDELAVPDESGNVTTDDLSISGGTIVLKSNLRRRLTGNTELFWNFKTESGSDNTFMQNEAALEVAMNSRFSLKLENTVRHNTDPAPGTDETDTITTVSLVYRLTE